MEYILIKQNKGIFLIFELYNGYVTAMSELWNIDFFAKCWQWILILDTEYEILNKIFIWYYILNIPLYLLFKNQDTVRN